MPMYLISLTFDGKDPQRIDDFLLRVLPGELSRRGESLTFSKSKIRRLIVVGAVSIGTMRERNPSARIARPSKITIKLDTEKFVFEKQPDDVAYELTDRDILFEDDVVIVVNKPAGLPTEATIVASRDHLHAAVQRFLARRAELETGKTVNVPYVGVHHRLDRETSGVILFTKTRAVNDAIHAMFLEHTARKEYDALSIRPPVLPQNRFSVENELGRISPKSAAAKWGAVESGGDRAHTDFELCETHESFLRIRAFPITGRTHQIRVHLAGIGLPILGDSLYGGPTEIAVRSSDKRLDQRQPEKPSGAAAFLRNKKEPSSGGDTDAHKNIAMISIPRVMLHAATLSFPHPVTGREIIVKAPLPDDFLAILSEQGKNGAASDTPQG